MTRWVATALLWSLIAAGDLVEIVRWQDAGAYIGEERWVEGTVVALRHEANVIRLIFDEQPGTFSAALIIGWLSRFPPDPANAYVGHTVRVFGRIRAFRNVPEVLILDPARVVVVDTGATTPAEPPTPIAHTLTPTHAAAAAAPAAPSTPEPVRTEPAREPTPDGNGRIRELEERLERMERRMEELLRPTPS